MGGIDDTTPPPLKRQKVMSESSSLNPSRISPVCSSMLSINEEEINGKNTESDVIVGPNGLLRRTEMVRIITQSLYALGYKRSAHLLEDESGIPLQSYLVSELREQILDGKWDESLASIRLLLLDPSSFESATCLILQQKFFEQLRMNDTMEALRTLRLEISPLNIKKERLHQLASCLICPYKMEALSPSFSFSSLSNGKYGKICPNPRERLLHELQQFVSPSVMIPERRLENLLEQALIVQRKACIFHNSMEQPLCLYYDHKCGRDQIPNRTVQVLQAHANEVWFLQFSHDGRYLASASKDCTAIIWEVVENGNVKLKYTLTGHQKEVSFVAWSPDDRMILTCGSEELLKLWDVESGDCKQTFGKLSYTVTACAWFPDGMKFISGGGDKCIYIWDIEGKEVDSWKGPQIPRVNDLTVSPDGKHMICIAEKEIRMYNLETKAERVIDEVERITSLSVSNDGSSLLVNLTNQEIHLWDIKDDAKLLFKYKGHRQTRYVIRSCFGGFDQAFIVSGSEDSQVYIWHRRNGEILEVLPGHSGTVNCVSWNPKDPYMFASASDDHTIRIWGVIKHAQKQKDTSNSNGVVHSANGGSLALQTEHK